MDTTLGPDTGRLFIRTGRAGIAARAGHDLLIEVTRWSARAEVPSSQSADDGGDLAAATVTAEIDLGSLAVREGTGGVKPLTAADRAEIEAIIRKTLSRNGAVARFTSTRVIPAASGGAIEGNLVLNGRTQPVRLQVREPAPGRYLGSATIAQTSFGITPYTGFFGALKLRDEVTIEVEVNLP